MTGRSEAIDSQSVNQSDEPSWPSVEQAVSDLSRRTLRPMSGGGRSEGAGRKVDGSRVSAVYRSCSLDGRNTKGCWPNTGRGDRELGPFASPPRVSLYEDAKPKGLSPSL